MTLDVAVIGSGFAGLAAAVRLREAGVTNFAIFERSDQLGGTWRDNTYPGCRCDVSSNLYSYSFAPNASWTNTFSYQPEIRRYLEDVAVKHDLRAAINFEHDVSDVTFDPVAKLWQLATTRGTYHARAVILGVGALAEPRLPELSGLNSFVGSVMHTARWDATLDLRGRRVGIIGTGASAIQVVPELAPTAARLTIFQRTAPWVLPHQGRPVPPRTQRLFARWPLTQRLVRWCGYWRRELLLLGLVQNPSRMSKGEEQARLFITASLHDARLREVVTPKYRMGCKRILISNDYYPALNRENVELVTSAIVDVEATGVRTADGVLHALDVLICATGFLVTDNPMGEKVHGRDGAVLADAFRGSLAHYRGTTFADFPNLFMLGGPNTGLGHSSIIFMLESQLNYVVKALRLVLERQALMAPTAAAAHSWTRALHDKLPTTVWGSGCSSWYLNESGRNTTIWPDFTFKFRRATRRFKSRDHDISR